MKKIYFNNTLTSFYNERGGEIGALTQGLRAPYDDEKKGNFFFRSTYSWDNYKTKTVMLKLSEGENIITFTNDGSYSFNNKATYAPDIGSITVRPVR